MVMPVKLNPPRKLWRGDYVEFFHAFPGYDLTGHAFTAQYRADTDRGEVIAEAVCTVTTQDVEIDGVLVAECPGVLEVLTKAEADKLPGTPLGEPAPVVYWDLQSEVDGKPHTWLYSDVKVGGDRTHG